jgi:hypothetical protein
MKGALGLSAVEYHDWLPNHKPGKTIKTGGALFSIAMNLRGIFYF